MLIASTEGVSAAAKEDTIAAVSVKELVLSLRCSIAAAMSPSSMTASLNAIEADVFP